MGLEDLKDKVRTCWASLDQQLINKAIDPWRPRLKTVVKVHGGQIEQLFTRLSCCCMKFSLFYLDIHASTHIHLCFTIVIEYSLGALILSYYKGIRGTDSGPATNVLRTYKF